MTYDNVSVIDVTFTSLSAGTYTIRAKYDIPSGTGSEHCDVKIGQLTVVEHTPIVADHLGDDVINTCESNVVKTITANVDNTLRYYAVDAEDGTVENSLTTDYLTFNLSNLADGSYKYYEYWAEYPDGTCAVKVGQTQYNKYGSILMPSTPIADTKVSCETLVYDVDTALLQAGVEYYLKDSEGNISQATVWNHGDDLSFSIANSGSYTVAGHYTWDDINSPKCNAVISSVDATVHDVIVSPDWDIKLDMCGIATADVTIAPADQIAGLIYFVADDTMKVLVSGVADGITPLVLSGVPDSISNLYAKYGSGNGRQV